MKYFFLLIFSILLLSSCNKTDTQPQAQKPVERQPPPPYTPEVEQAFKQLDKEKMKKHESAIEVLTNFPPGGPIPPHLLPAKDIKLVSQNDSMATYSITSASTGAKAKVMLKKMVIHQKDTMWNVVAVEQSH
jgi:hypothetical protein